ncbi:MAG TPA: YtxH domain-containing protein [Anaerolineae bacterium]|jgi:gas vesicle protein|nr:YtxH domain-containing protein [Anaerolineae bacterium]
MMAERVRAIRGSAMAAGEQLGERASELLEEARERNLLTFALVAVSGFAFGILAGILLAPASGYETRGRISERASEAMASAREMARRRAEEISEEAERTA